MESSYAGNGLAPCAASAHHIPSCEGPFILSWKASGWAKGTRGHRSHGQKLVLMILADYYDDERGFAWPSQARLSEDCEMPLRTIQWALKQLQEGGYVTRLQKGNQHQPSKWALHLADAHLSEPAISEPATIAGTGEPARSDMVNPQDRAGEPASPVGTSLQEPEEEEPPKDIYEPPAWHDTFHEVPGIPACENNSECAKLQKWIDKEQMGRFAVETAKGLRDSLAYSDTRRKKKWAYEKADGNTARYSDPRTVFRTWSKLALKREIAASNNGSRPQRGRKQARGAAAWGVTE